MLSLPRAKTNKKKFKNQPKCVIFQTGLKYSYETDFLLKWDIVQIEILEGLMLIIKF